jgi:hypothetical protein
MVDSITVLARAFVAEPKIIRVPSMINILPLLGPDVNFRLRPQHGLKSLLANSCFNLSKTTNAWSTAGKKNQSINTSNIGRINA